MRESKILTTQGDETMDLASFVPALLTFIANRLTSSGSTLYRRRFGIGVMDFRIMAMLSIEPGASGARIADVIDLDKAAVSRALASLQRQKYVRSAPDLGRARRLRLTKSGQALYRDAWKLAQERERRLLSLFSLDEQQILREMLRRLLRSTTLVAALSTDAADAEWEGAA